MNYTTRYCSNCQEETSHRLECDEHGNEMCPAECDLAQNSAEYVADCESCGERSDGIA